MVRDGGGRRVLDDGLMGSYGLPNGYLGVYTMGKECSGIYTMGIKYKEINRNMRM